MSNFPNFDLYLDQSLVALIAKQLLAECHVALVRVECVLQLRAMTSVHRKCRIGEGRTVRMRSSSSVCFSRRNCACCIFSWYLFSGATTSA